MNSSTYKNIFYEYNLVKDSSKAVVVLQGMPSSPKNYPLFKELESEGFNVFFPRYEGTWESEGEFLERSPTDAIDEFLTYIEKEFGITDIFILGSSFGGYVSLLLANTNTIKGICTLSPVVSFKDVIGINTLENHINENLSEKYRFSHENWQRLINDEFGAPVNSLEIQPEKILLIAAKDDSQILFDDLISFSQKHSIHNFIEIEGEHITLSNISDKLIGKIVSFYNQLQK